MSTIRPGLCRHCGCSGPDSDPPHRLRTGETCCWLDSSQMVCSGCDQAEADRKKRARAEAAAARPQSEWARLKALGWGDGAIRIELERRRKKGKAA